MRVSAVKAGGRWPRYTVVVGTEEEEEVGAEVEEDFLAFLVGFSGLRGRTSADREALEEVRFLDFDLAAEAATRRDFDIRVTGRWLKRGEG